MSGSCISSAIIDSYCEVRSTNSSSDHSRFVTFAAMFVADFVAKVGGPLQVRNFRIQRARRLNQCCAAGLFFESMLRVRMRKFFLQQYRHLADIPERPANVRFWGAKRTLANRCSRRQFMSTHPSSNI